MKLQEQHIYGSARLGVVKQDIDMIGAVDPSDVGEFDRVRGMKRYELSNHLGNVLTVISDRKMATVDNGVNVYYHAEIISYSDYYPFGAPMSQGTTDRTWSVEEYRFGFNGMESVDEMIGESNGYDFGARMYDARVGRWSSVDPILKAQESSYCAFSNNPLLFVDKDGRDTLVVHVQKMLENNGRQTVILRVTFSLIQNGCEEAQSIDVNVDGKITQRTEVYFTVPASSWVDGNIWVPESGKQVLSPIRFEEYQGGSGTEYKNAIRLKHVKKDGTRILAHKGTRGSHSVGCNIPTLTIPNDEGYNFPTVGSQEILDGIRKLFDETIPSSETKDEFGRKVQKPDDGYDFMSKTNSSAASLDQETPADEKD